MPSRIMEDVLKDKLLIRDSQHGSTKIKLCLINLVVFHNEVTASVNKAAVDVIFLDFCKAFDICIYMTHA